MKTILNTLLLFFSIALFSQDIQIIEANIGEEFDFGIDVQKDWKRRDEIINSNIDWNNLSDQDDAIIKKYGEVYEDMWDILGGGCSWYCGAGNYSVKTSSELATQEKNSYATKNLHDFSYKTAWVEGVKGYGIGEFIEFDFDSKHPQLTEIIIVNGYVKSKTAWENNSRVKTLKMFLNDKPYAILNLKNSYTNQRFIVKPIGNSHKDFKNENLLNWQIKFEIVEIYKGKKYDDTVITEIYFNGIGVH